MVNEQTTCQGKKSDCPTRGFESTWPSVEARSGKLYKHFIGLHYYLRRDRGLEAGFFGEPDGFPDKWGSTTPDYQLGTTGQFSKQSRVWVPLCQHVWPLTERMGHILRGGF